MVIKITCQQVGLRRPDRPLILPTFSASHHIPLSVHDQRKTGSAAFPVFRFAAHSVTTGVHITLLDTNFLSKFSSRKASFFWNLLENLSQKLLRICPVSRTAFISLSFSTHLNLTSSCWYYKAVPQAYFQNAQQIISHGQR